MHADGVAVDTASRFARTFRAGPAVIAQDQLIGGQGYCLKQLGAGKAFGERCGDGVGCLRRAALEDRLAHFLQPAVIPGTSARFAAQQSVLVEEPWDQRADAAQALGITLRFRLHAVAHGLAQQGMRLFGANDAGQVPGAIRQYHPMDLAGILHGNENTVEGRVRAGRQGGIGAFGVGYLGAAYGIAQRFGATALRRELGRVDWMQHLGAGPPYSWIRPALR